MFMVKNTEAIEIMVDPLHIIIIIKVWIVTVSHSLERMIFLSIWFGSRYDENGGEKAFGSVFICNAQINITLQSKFWAIQID